MLSGGRASRPLSSGALWAFWVSSCSWQALSRSVATDPIADLYHAPGATAGDQATLVFLWQATMGILEMLLVTGLFILPIGLIALGVAMLGSPAFGKGFGGVSVALGVVGGVAAVVLLVDPASPIVAVGVFALIIFHLVLGWKVYSLSRSPVRNLNGRDNERDKMSLSKA